MPTGYGMSGGMAGGGGGGDWLSFLLQFAPQLFSQGADPRQAMAQRVGQQSSQLPKAPSILGKKAQLGQTLGSTALGFVPGAGPFLQGGASLLGHELSKSAGQDYLTKIMGHTPGLQRGDVNLENPYVAPSHAEKMKGIGEDVAAAAGGVGAGAAAGAALGSVVPGAGTIAGGLIGGALGAFGGSRQKKRAQERQRQMEIIQRRNQQKLQTAQQDAMARRQQQQAQRASFQPPVNNYLSQALTPQGWNQGGY